MAINTPAAPAHAGKLDVDLVIDLQILADTQAQHALEGNIQEMGFEWAVNSAATKLAWPWQTRSEHAALMVLEPLVLLVLLVLGPGVAGGQRTALADSRHDLCTVYRTIPLSCMCPSLLISTKSPR